MTLGILQFSFCIAGSALFLAAAIIGLINHIIHH